MSPPSLNPQDSSVGVAGRPFLTVLTAPIFGAPTRAYRSLRRAVRPFVKPGAPLPAPQPYPGHTSLVRSVVDGLRAIGADFNFNPDRFGRVGTAVYAPANEALRQAAAMKRRGAIRHLVAGPVNALFPDDAGGILLMPEIDLILVPADWVREFFQSEPALMAKLRVCPAGVDAEYWTRGTAQRLQQALVYWKSGSQAFCEDVEHSLRRAGLAPVRVRYGDYDRETFKRVLSESLVGVFLSSFETQGLALAEAWAMDVPTLVWDPRAPTEWRGRAFHSRSSCPYLTAATGRSWQTIDELDAGLRDVIERRATFTPRDWILSHMTDAICAHALYGIIREAAAAR